MADILFYLKIYNTYNQMFECDEDYQVCLEKLEISSKKHLTKIHAYCMLPNSCHLLVETREPVISKFVSAIRANNKTVTNRNNYNSIIIEKNTLSAEASFYIHALPYLTGLRLNPADYPWSSLIYYCSATKSPAWLNTDSILSQISVRYTTAYKDYRAKFQSLINGPSDFFMDNLIKKMRDSKIIGSKHFKKIIHFYSTKVFPAGKTVSLEKINSLVERKNEKTAKHTLLAKIYLSYLYSGATNRETGIFFGGLSPSRVSQIVKETQVKINKDKYFKSFIKRMENRVKDIINKS